MKNVHTIEIKIEGKEWADCLDSSFKKKVKDIKVDGFRKGAIPKEVYIKKFGIESLYTDAVDMVVGSAYEKALKDNNLTPFAEPKVDIKGISDSTIIFEFTIVTKPEITLGAYKNLKVKKDKIEVTKEEIEKEIESLQNKYAEIVIKSKGTVEKGNTAVIDFEGTVDGKKLDGGTGENYPLEIGSNTFIPGFEDNLIGMKVNETKTIDLKFPSDYVDELKDKEVTFKVTVREIKERKLPELNEDFYKDLGYDVKDKKGLETKIEEEIKKRKELQVEDKYIEDVLDAASKNMKVTLNEEIIDEEVHRMMHQMEEQLKMQGLTMDQYFEFTHTTHHDMHEKMEPEAIKRIKYRLLLESISEKEDIKVTEAEAKKQAKEDSEKYGMKEEEYINMFGGIELIKYDIKMKKTIEFLKNN
jgi:trigger factor